MRVGGCILNDDSRAKFEAMAMHADHLARALGIEFARPAVIDPRSWSTMRNQSSEGSCNGHASAAAQEQCHFAQTHDFRQFSPDFMYYRAQQFDGLRGDVGSTVSGAVRVAHEIGALLEERMPYTPRYNPGDVPINANAEAAPFKIATVADLKTYRDIVEWIGKGFGGVWWGCSWNVTPDGQGYIRRWSTGGGGHATALLGYGGPVDADGLPEFVWLKNSWGTSFGLSGWAKVTRRAIEDALRQQYTEVAGISDMPSLKPRVVDWRKASVFT